jgi:clorobiocin biosynthesis protein CloN5
VTSEEIESTLTEFIREEFLWGDNADDLTKSTPLLEWGILDSLRTTFLLNFIREKMGVDVPPGDIDARNFRDIQSITETVCRLTPTPSATQSDKGEARESRL